MRRPHALAAFVALALGSIYAAACAPLIGLEDAGYDISRICACQEFNFAPKLGQACRDEAAKAEHQTPEFLDEYLAASGPSGVSCPDCTHLQECLARLELDERYIPCESNDQCAGNKCCLVPGQEQKTCCSTCEPCAS